MGEGDEEAVLISYQEKHMKCSSVFFQKPENQTQSPIPPMWKQARTGDVQSGMLK